MVPQSRRYRLKRAIKRLSGLVLYYPLHETEGTTAYDYSSSKLNGTYANAPSPLATRIGRGANFNGSTDKVTRADNAVLKPTTAMSLLGFCTLDTLTGSGYRAIINKGSGEEYAMDFDEGNDRLRGLIKLTSASWQTRSTSVVTAGPVYMEVLTYDGNLEVIYLNGTSIENENVADEAITTSTDALVVGARGGDRFWDGILAHVAVFNRALTATEVRKLARIAGYSA